MLSNLIFSPLKNHVGKSSPYVRSFENGPQKYIYLFGLNVCINFRIRFCRLQFHVQFFIAFPQIEYNLKH